MEQTLINSNNNESNYNNGNQGYSSSSTLDNQFQGQVQNQPNQLYMMQPNPTPQNNLSQNLNTSSAQILPPQNDINLFFPPQNQGAPQELQYYQPQNEILNPSQENPPSQTAIIPGQQNIPLNNYSTPQTTNLNIKTIPQNQDQNKNSQKSINMSQISNKSIYQKDENVFYISLILPERLYLPLAFVILGILSLLLIISNKEAVIPIIILSSMLILIGVSYAICTNRTIYFILGPNNLTIIKTILCCKSTTTYNPG